MAHRRGFPLKGVTVLGKLDLTDYETSEHSIVHARIVLAWALEQAQADVHNEVDCYVLRHFPSESEHCHALEAIERIQVNLGATNTIQEELCKLRNRLCLPLESTSASGSGSITQEISITNGLVIFEHSDVEAQWVDSLIIQALRHSQIVLHFSKGTSSSTLTLLGRVSSATLTTTSLNQISITLGRLAADQAPLTIGELRGPSFADIEWQKKIHKDHYRLSSRCVHDMFSETASVQPYAPAIDAWDGQLTYEQLDELSSELADKLRYMGIGAEDVVPLLFERSKWAVVAMLTVLKAGGAFLFLDPAHPTTRLQSLIDRVEAKFSITSTDLQKHLSVLHRPLILIEDLRAGHVSNGHTQLPPLANPQNAAFLLFTSGSSGEPKGVITEHQGLCSGILEQAFGLGIARNSRVMQGSLFSFAAAIVEMLFTVVVGGCVCIPLAKDRFNDFAGVMNRMRATFAIFPPSYTAITDPSVFETLKTAVVGSEALNEQAARNWAKQLDVRHGYGTTETNTINAAALLSGDNVNYKSIGRGFAHNFWIVDATDHNRLARRGYTGEILIEGAAIARGYLKNEEQTTKAFIEPPKWYIAMRNGVVPEGTKFYKTGDLGRLTENGEVEILGRTDTMQVKLRGQRIELAEVERVALEALPSGSSIFAELILPSLQARPKLVIFLLVGKEHLGEHSSEDSVFITPYSACDRLKNHLRTIKAQLDVAFQERLPAFMRPSCLIPLRGMPKLATGKAGRRLLREWAGRYPIDQLYSYTADPEEDSDVRHHKLQGHEEAELARIWSTVFGLSLDDINANSDFYALGGDSLSAMKMVEMAREVRLEVDVAAIMKHHRLQDVAATMSKLSETPSQCSSNHNSEVDQQAFTFDISQLGISDDNVIDILPTTDSQSRAIELGTGDEGCLVYHFVVSLERDGLDTTRLRSTLQKLVGHYDALRTLFVEQDGKIMQVVMRDFRAPIEEYARNDENDGQSKLSSITSSHFALNSVPTQFWICTKSGLTAELIVRLSHAQFDGVSLSMLWKTLSRLYAGEVLDPAPRYSEYVREVLLPNNHGSIEYFRDLLRPVPFTDLVRHDKGGNHPQDRLLRWSCTLPSLPFSPAIVFEAAWAFVLAQESGNAAVVFDHIVTGRQISRLRTTELFGACLNDVPVVVYFNAGLTVHGLLTQIRDQHFASAQHETLGFRSILGACKPDHWPADARMTSSVQFRGFENVTAFDLGGLNSKVHMVERSMDLEDLTVLVTPKYDGGGPREFDVVFASSSETVPEADARLYFDLFSRTVGRFAENLNAVV